MSRLKALAGLAPEARVRRVLSPLAGTKAYWEVFDVCHNKWQRVRVTD